MTDYDLVIIGGGPAGLAGAISAKKQGLNNILLLEREPELGGILNQCIHDGFGLHYFKESMTGPEYAQKLIDEFRSLNIPHKTGAMVLDITDDKKIEFSHPDGYQIIKSKSILLAMGCRERTRFNIFIPGTRPSGIFTAGSAQTMVNLQNLRIGNKTVILGSGDIGLIMARRLTLEGIEVAGVYEIMPFAAGLERNIQQCLKDFHIPLHFSSTVTKIYGNDRVSAIEISKVDHEGKIIPGTQEIVHCDTLLLAVGLIPENELSLKAGVILNGITGGPDISSDYQTNIPGIFAGGNVLQIHDLADWASMEAERAVSNIFSYLKTNKNNSKNNVLLKYENPIRFALPVHIKKGSVNTKLSFRVKEPILEPKLIIKNSTGNIIFQQKFIKLLPSELVQIELNDPINSTLLLELV